MTIKDIARKCGVSVSTVSRVINNHEYVNEDVREHVLAVIREEHFVPHSGAVGLVKPQKDTIGIVVRGTDNMFFNSMLPIFEQTAHQYGFSVIAHQIKSHDNEVLAAASFAKGNNLKGVILLGGSSEHTENEMGMLSVPFVCCTFRNVVDDKVYPYVGIDDEAEAFRAVTELLKRGHRRIAVLIPAMDDSSVSELRFSGYRKALREYGIEVDHDLVVETSSFSAESAYERMKALIESGADFSAAFVISDYMAIAAMKAANEMGKRIPEDCAFIAIDGIEISNYMIPTLATMVQPCREIAEKSIEILFGLISGQPVNAVNPVQAVFRAGGSLSERV